jgi:hypothetical protein
MRIIATTLAGHSIADLWTWIALYVGPDLLLPLTSALAAIAGVLLMFWNKVIGFVRGAWRRVTGKPKEPRA